MSRPVDIALLQTRPMADFDAALTEALGLAKAAVKAGATFLFLPEYCGGLRSDGPMLTPPAAPEGAHPVLNGLRDFARDAGVWMQIGSIAVTIPGAPKIRNRGYMIDDQGQIRGHYDKIHMFDIALSPTEVYRESDTVEPGDISVVHDTPIGGIGHSICYDLRFPSLFRDQAQAGADVLTCPAAFTRKTGQAHWHVLNRARAIENTSYMVSACAIGAIPGGGESYGHSLVVSPWGDVIADGGDLPGVVHARIDLDHVAAVRARIPSLSHDRTYTLNHSSERNVA